MILLKEFQLFLHNVLKVTGQKLDVQWLQKQHSKVQVDVKQLEEKIVIEEKDQLQDYKH